MEFYFNMKRMAWFSLALIHCLHRIQSFSYCHLLLLFSRRMVPDSLWPPWTAACQASLSITNTQSLLKLMSIESLMPSNHWCHLTISSSVIPFSSCLQSFPASGSFVINSLFVSAVKYWSFSFSISPSNEYSGLISLRTDWLDLLPCMCSRDNCFFTISDWG